MNATDITTRQLDILVLVRSVEEFIKDEHETYGDLGDALAGLAEKMQTEEVEQYIEDIFNLTEKGYLISNAEECDIEMLTTPYVEGITPKGKTALDEWEREITQKLENKADMKEAQIVENINNGSNNIIINVGNIGAINNILTTYSKHTNGIDEVNLDINLLKHGGGKIYDFIGDKIGELLKK